MNPTGGGGGINAKRTSSRCWQMNANNIPIISDAIASFGGLFLSGKLLEISSMPTVNVRMKPLPLDDAVICQQI